MHNPNNDLRLSNMDTYKRHSQQDGSTPEKYGERNAGNKANGQNTKLHNNRQNKSRRYLESHDKNKMEVGWTRSAHDGQQLDSKMYRMLNQKWEEIKRQVEKKMV